MAPRDGLSLNSMLKRYVAPRMWEGTASIDGGQGPRALINELLAHPQIAKAGFPFFMQAASRPVPHEGLGQVYSDEGWRVAFPGRSHPLLLRLVREIRHLGATEQKWILTSHLGSAPAELDEPLLRLVITAGAREDDEVWRVVRGYWRPCFSHPQEIGGWSALAQETRDR